MRRLLRALAGAAAGAALAAAFAAQPVDADQALREAFAHAASAPEFAAELQQLASLRPTLGYQVALEACERAVARRARGEDAEAEADFAGAERIARALAGRTEAQVLDILISGYRSFDREAALQRSRARDAISRASVLANQGRLEDAQKNVLAALRVGKELDDPVITADAQRIGGVVAKNAGDLAGALQWTESALKWYRQMRNMREAGRATGNLGQLHRQLGNYERALELSAEARGLAELAGDPATLAGEWASAGLVYNRLGQYRQALEHFSNAMRTYPEFPGAERDRAIIFQNLGLAYENLGMYRESAGHFQRGLDLLGDAEAWEVDRAVLRASLGNVHGRLGDLALAKSYYASALNAFRTNKHWPRVLLAEGNLAKIALEQGELEDALKRYRAVEALAGDNVQMRALALLGKTEAALRLGQPRQALDWAAQACAIPGQGAPMRASCERAQGYAHRLLGDARAAAAHYARAIEATEEVRAALGDPTEIPAEALFGDARVTFQEAIEVALERHAAQPAAGHDRAAFLLSERAKSGVFQDQVRRAGMRLGAGRDPEFQALLTRDRAALVQVLALTRAARQAAPADRPAAEARREEAARRLREIRAQLFEKYPVYREVEQPQPASIERIQAALAADEVLLAYALGPSRSVAFVLRRGSFAAIPLEMSEAEIASRVAALRRDLEPPARKTEVGELAAALRRADPAAALELYRRIFAPVEAALGGAARIYVAGDGALFLLPFGALVEPGFDPARFRAARARADGRREPLLDEYRGVPYLGYRLRFRYLPAASAIAYLRPPGAAPRPAQWETPLVAFADPVFGPGEEAAAEPGRLARLEASAQEATGVAELLHAPPGAVYLRERASESNVYAAPLKGARYLLFSTHGLLGGDHAGAAEPALALAQVGNPQGQDGFLTMSEVIGLDLAAELTVLSACSTAGQPSRAERQGEGFAGIARSFMYAGSRAVLVTHWSVFDTVARDFVVEFFRRAPGAGADAALAGTLEARRGGSAGAPGLRIALAHPTFWAGFALLGD